MLTLPGLIDPHVHLREPGAIHKEDWSTGTSSALAGGFTCVLAMPNTQPPITDSQTLAKVKDIAKLKAHCDYGIYLGAGIDNVDIAHTLSSKVCGLKMYLDSTFGPLRLDELSSISAHIHNWEAEKPIVVHSEGRSLSVAILFAMLYNKPVHIAHISRADEIALIKLAKEKGIPITCEVTPHHLFLSTDDIASIGKSRSEVRPRLASPSDKQALWDNIDIIDCFATDHAPHTLMEKDSENPPPGFPGLETALALFLNAVKEGRLTLDDVIKRMYTNPKRIFKIPDIADTFITVDPDFKWTVRGNELHSKCGWTPFEGWELQGKVVEVTLRGKVVYKDGKILSFPGYGNDVFK